MPNYVFCLLQKMNAVRLATKHFIAQPLKTVQLWRVGKNHYIIVANTQHKTHLLSNDNQWVEFDTAHLPSFTYPQATALFARLAIA